MDRRKRHIVVIGVAVVTAALASFGVFLTIKRMPVREVEVARRFVAVAAHPLPTGAMLSAKDVRLVAWPANSMVPGSFSTVDAVVNRGLLAAVVENEPLIESKLASANAGAGLPPAIPPGMRAMSVRVNDVIGVAGFLDPGTRVDVVVTIRREKESTSRTVVSNVQVLTAGIRQDQQKTAPAKNAKTPGVAPVVTLLVTPDDAERMALAQAEGQIMLVLRNPLDTEPTATSGVRSAALFGASEPEAAPEPKPVRVRREPPPPPVVEAAAPPKMYTVEAIRAAKRTEEVVR